MFLIDIMISFPVYIIYIYKILILFLYESFFNFIAFVDSWRKNFPS